MRVDWKEIWDANPEIFIGSGWEQCTEEKRKIWHLPSQFSYFSAGDLNLRVGIVASQGIYKEDEFLLGGILFGNRLGNGARTVIYFVAQDFSPVFFGSIAKLGGTLIAKAVYWREKLTPSLYPVQEKDYLKSLYKINFGDPRPNWEFWERQLNPVARNHLKIIKNYFDSLSKRRVKASFEKSRILYRWGNIEIAEIKQKGNKFELATKVKWTRNKNIATKFLKSGWVDLSGTINEEFCRAILGILDLLENMEVNGSLDNRDHLAIKLLHDKEFVPEFFGTPIEFPWLAKERSEFSDTGQLIYFELNHQISALNFILDKPVQRMVSTLLVYTALEYSIMDGKKLTPIQWNQKIYVLTLPELMDELRLCQSWLLQTEKFPIILLPEDWKTEGFKKYKGVTQMDWEDFFTY
ncbi:MAG: hypothetical protein GX434_16350 [Peptococcaceae bacterium]|nr:hypothetical protein [Peptococcaceae bacterium]